MADIDYKQKRGTVFRNYANASRKAARSAEVADDGAKAARASQKRNIKSKFKAAEQSGRVITPDGRQRGRVITADSYGILKKFSNKYSIEV